MQRAPACCEIGLKRTFAVARRLARAVGAKIVVGFDFVLQALRDEFDHDGIVNEAKHRHAVRDQIMRVRKIGQGIEHVLPVFVFERPFGIGQHADQDSQTLKALANELRDLRSSDLREKRIGLFDNLSLAEALHFFASAANMLAEILEIGLFQFKAHFNSHGLAPRCANWDYRRYDALKLRQ